MDVQLIIALNVIAICLLTVLMVLLHRQTGWQSWALANAVVIAGTGLALLAQSEWAGVIGLALFGPLIIAPSLLARQAYRLAYRNRMADAARYAGLAALLHPSARLSFMARLYGAQSHGSLDDNCRALQDLARRSTPAQAVSLQAVQLRLADDWPGVLALAEAHPEQRMELGALIVRALAETGRLPDAIATFGTIGPHLAGVDLDSTRLFMLAFAGRARGVEALLGGELANLDDAAKAYWRAIADKSAASPDPRWRETMRWIAATTEMEGVRRAAERQLATEPTPRHLTSAEAQMLDTMEARSVELGTARKSSPLQAPVTLLLIAGIFVMYGIEMLRGGSENMRTLIELGALWPRYVLERGEWWRLGAAMFLHYGHLHVLLNTVLLYLLGRDCELGSGSLHMAIVYILGGLASSAAVLWLMASGIIPTAALVGASGAIFAVFGSEVALRVKRWLANGDVSDRRGLIGIGFALLIQFAIDLSIPQVSLSAHASGLVAGIVLGAILGGGRRQRA